MRFSGPLIVVEDMERSRKFYEEVLNQKVLMDLDGNITFAGGFSIQRKDIWLSFIERAENDLKEQENNFELYFEEEDYDSFLEKMKGFPEIEYLNPLKTYPWLQMVVRFYDPDNHLIEVGESMAEIAKRLLNEGLTIEAVAEKIMHPVDFVEAVKEGNIN